MYDLTPKGICIGPFCGFVAPLVLVSLLLSAGLLVHRRNSKLDQRKCLRIFARLVLGLEQSLLHLYTVVLVIVAFRDGGLKTPTLLALAAILVVAFSLEEEYFFRKYLKSLNVGDYSCFTERLSHFILINESRPEYIFFGVDNALCLLGLSTLSCCLVFEGIFETMSTNFWICFGVLAVTQSIICTFKVVVMCTAPVLRYAHKGEANDEVIDVALNGKQWYLVMKYGIIQSYPESPNRGAVEKIMEFILKHHHYNDQESLKDKVLVETRPTNGEEDTVGLTVK